MAKERIVFWGRLKSSRLQLENPDIYFKYIANLKEGQRYGITIQEERSLLGSKSNQQLRYFNGVICKLIAEESGQSLEEVKLELKMYAVSPQYFTNKAGDTLKYYPSCSEMSKEEMSDLIDQSIQYAAQNYSMQIPGPADHEWMGYGPA